MKPTIAFFGTPETSVLVVQKLLDNDYPIVCIVTKPPRPVGRKKIVTKTAVHLWAEMQGIPVLTPETHHDKPNLFQDDDVVTKEVGAFKPEILVAANYTVKIPDELVQQTKYKGLNVHPSLLPSFKGPAPIPYALLHGEQEIGVSVITLVPEFDHGNVISQEVIPTANTDTAPILIQKLFKLGAQLLINSLPKYIEDPNNYIKPSYKPSQHPRMTREIGFEPWDKIEKAMENGSEAERIERKWRALHPWPGLWTKIKVKSTEKRLKILKCILDPTSSTPNPKLVLDTVQLEGKKPVTGKDFFSRLSSRTKTRINS